MANMLTAVRLLLAVPLALLIASPDPRAPVVVALVMLLAIATDLADGPMARRAGTASAFGGVFDHATDCVFVVSGLTAGVLRGDVPWILPVLVVAAFVQYTVDSWWFHGERRLRGSRLGRWNGILYFFPVCGVILIQLGLTFLTPVLTAVCWLLVGSTAVSMAGRVMLAWRAARTGPPSPS
ncbi:MAG: CDP-alcohol phosphatidyltransferase family protein [Vicinamibacterales bacterium]